MIKKEMKDNKLYKNYGINKSNEYLLFIKS